MQRRQLWPRAQVLSKLRRFVQWLVGDRRRKAYQRRQYGQRIDRNILPDEKQLRRWLFRPVHDMVVVANTCGCLVGGCSPSRSICQAPWRQRSLRCCCSQGAFAAATATVRNILQTNKARSSDWRTALQCKTVGSYQLYPRAFWMWASGGMNLAEAFLLAVWIVLHCVMLWNWYIMYVRPYKYGTTKCQSILRISRQACASQTCIVHHDRKPSFATHA